jgi:hypothetical protein
MAKLVLALAFLLAIAAVERASAAPSFCTYEDGAWVCGYNTYWDGPA